MKFKSELVTAVSGSIGGTTYLRSNGHLVRQAKPRPVNTHTPHQRSVRSSFQAIAIAWRETLSESQRQAWSNYAALTPLSGTFGDPLTLSGSQMFLRCNSLRANAGLQFVTDGPTTPGLARIASGPITIISFLGFMQIFFDSSLPWAQTAQGFISIQTTRFLPRARNSYSGKRRILRNVFGFPGGIPPGINTTTNAFDQQVTTEIAGLKILITLIASEPDGRLSPVNQHFATIQ